MAAFDVKHDSLQILARASISECSICLDAYHLQDRIPRMLKACGHTFCEQCLVQLRAKAVPSTLLRCPSCRTETKLKEMETFPKNYALLENIEQAQTLRREQAEVMKTKKCDRCAANPAEFGCGECVASFCPKCWGKIHSVGVLRSHVKVDCSEVFQVTCAKHPSKTADLVCLEPTCASYGGLICLLCEKTAAHKGHLTEPIEQVADEKREELREAIKKAQKNVDFALSVLVQVQEHEELLSRKDDSNASSAACSAQEERASAVSTRDQAVDLINTTIDSLILNLNMRRNTLIEQVDALAGEKTKKLEEQRGELTTFISHSYTHLQEASQVLTKTNDRLFMIGFQTHYNPLINVSKTQLFPLPVVTPLVDLHLPQILPESVGTITDDGLVPQHRISVSEFAGIFVHKFGSSGSGDGQLMDPAEIRFGHDGLLYVADQSNHRIQVFRTDGTFVRKFGSKGLKNGQFTYPTGIAFGPDKLLYVSDCDNHRIQVFQSDGTFVRKFGSQGNADGQFNSPVCLAFSSDGLLYVSDQSNHRIQVLRTNGAFVGKFGISSVRSSEPMGLFFHSTGFFYVCDQANHRIQKFSPKGTLSSKFGSQGTRDGRFNAPGGVTSGPDGLLYVTDQNNNRIQVFRTDDTFVCKFGCLGS